MWNIGNIPMVVQKWMPDELKEKPEVTSIPLWVHLKHVPMNMFSWQGPSFITSAVGSPDRLHPETAACTNFKIAKVFVIADLTKELPSKINFTKDGKTTQVEFSYPWLPPRCSGCGKWGHLEKVCATKKKEESGNFVQEAINGESENKNSSVEDVVNEKRKTESEEDQSVIEVISEVEEGEIKETWADVTPGKGSRSPNLKFGQVKILTPSRYSALLQVDENGETINQVDYEEILSIEEEVVTVEFTDGRVVEEKSVPKELKNSEEGDTRGQNTKVIAGIEHWPDLGSNTTRPILPRKAKTMHKTIAMKEGTPGKLGKGGTKNSSQ